MAVAKAVSSLNPLVASRITLEATLDRFSEIFSAVPAAISRKRLQGFSMPDFAAACSGTDVAKIPSDIPCAAAPADDKQK